MLTELLKNLRTTALSGIMAVATLWAGPADLGYDALRAALDEKGLTLDVEQELNLDPPETFHITVVSGRSIRVSGGDLRGLMYGLFEAAEQVRSEGAPRTSVGSPGFALRSIRIAPSDGELAAPGFYQSERWTKFMDMAARYRINRVTLVLPVNRLEADRLRFLSQLARDHAVDFHLGIRAPLTTGLRAHLRRILDECVLIRGVQVEAAREPVDYFRMEVFPALQSSGRLVTLDLRGGDARQDVVRAAIAAGVPLELASRSKAASLSHPFHTVVPAQSTPIEPDPVRDRLTVLANSGASGFEIDLSGPNIENYERLYWSWGRLGYDHVSPSLAPGKPSTRSAK